MDTLEKNGFFDLTICADLQVKIDILTKKWKVYCSLSDEVKSAVGYNSARKYGVGYKQQRSHRLSKKEVFDYTPKGEDWLVSKAKQPNCPQELGELIATFTQVAQLTEPYISKFSEQVEDSFEIHGFNDEVRHCSGYYFFRLLHYLPGAQVGEEIARPHNDRSAFTLHLLESAPGLERLTFRRDWVRMTISKGHALVTPAMQIQYKTEGVLRATCHRVVWTEEAARNDRYSIVCFIVLPESPQCVRDRVEKFEDAPGFNYSMSHERFSRLFLSSNLV